MRDRPINSRDLQNNSQVLQISVRKDHAQHTPLLASPKNSLNSGSVTVTCILINIVHGFLGGLPVFGVRIPVLPAPSVVTGDFTSSPRCALSCTLVDSGNTGVDALLGVPSFSAFSRSTLSALSLSFRSFFSFFLAFSRSAFSAFAPGEAPLIFGAGLSLPGDMAVLGGGVDVYDWAVLALLLLERCGGKARSEPETGAGVGPLVGGWLGVPAVLCCGPVAGKATVVELGVGAIVAVRRYA
jgi:hypothetical protein